MDRDPTDDERNLYAEVTDAVLDTLDAYFDHPLISLTDDTINPTILIDGAFRAVADIIVANHAGHPPGDCTCVDNAIRSLRYAIAASLAEWKMREPSHAQH